MEPLYKSLKDYVDSNEYFNDAINWYKYKYIHPLSQRSFVFILSVVICALFIGVAINIRNLFPVVIQAKYSINADTSANKAAKITRADKISNDPLSSITDIMIRRYVVEREGYKYNNLKKQFTYIKNNSTRIVFRRFFNYMNIDNAESPILKYQKDTTRTSEIISSDFLDKNKALIKLRSIAKNSAGEIVENALWSVAIDYEIDEININLPSGSRFNFTVTDYQLKLLEDKKKK